MFSSRVIAMVLLPALAGCAYYDTKRKRIDVGPEGGAGIRDAYDRVQENRAAELAKERSSITIQCELERTEGAPQPCTGHLVGFSIEPESDGASESPIRYPDRQGRAVFPVPASQKFRIHVHAPESLGAVVTPSDSGITAGTRLRVVLK